MNMLSPLTASLMTFSALERPVRVSSLTFSAQGKPLSETLSVPDLLMGVE
jgi:hypothetical protein